MVPSRITTHHCTHLYCKTQDIPNPWGQELISYCCHSPIKGSGVYDCHSADRERFRHIQQSDALAVIIWSPQDPPPTQKMLEQAPIQLFIQRKGELDEIIPLLKKAKKGVYILIDPLTSTFQEVLTIRNDLKAQGLIIEDQSTFTGTYYDKRLGTYKDRTPSIEVTQESSIEKPLLSVIIPHFNHHREIISTLDTLLENNPPYSYEIIVIDDGSDTPLELRGYNLTLIRLERPSRRRMGENTWRSGVARNIGFTYSVGEYILFLDADTLTPQDFVQTTIQHLKTNDIIQFKRLHLKEGLPLNSFDQLLSKPENFYSRSGGYFEDFQNDPAPWKERPFGWKYFSTFCVAMKRHIFTSYGPFSPSFCLYGFDDVELGLRAWNKDVSFKKSSLPVIAQFHEKERSEYQNDPNRKRELLQKTAQLLFIQNPTQEVYDALAGIM